MQRPLTVRPFSFRFPTIPERIRPQQGTASFVMAMILLVLGFYLIYPIVLLLIMSFNVAPSIFAGPAVWGLDNWTAALRQPRILQALGNSFLIWGLVAGISLPMAVGIAWVLGRTRVPFGRGLEYGFWVAYLFPGLASTVGWIMVLHPTVGFANRLLEILPFVDSGPFNIFSVPGIVWVRLMGDGLAYKVILLTPAFRNMDRSLEEAARVSGATDLRTMWKVTLPMMISPITLVFALQLIRIFQGFETEWLLGARWGFYVYSTLIYRLVAAEAVPQYGQATVLASVTLLIIALIIPFQRWVLQRRQYTTVTGSYRPGLVELGRLRWLTFGLIGSVLLLLTAVPFVIMVVGSFMTRSGFFDTTPLWTLRHWQYIFADRYFWSAFRTTLLLATIAGIVSPLLFSFLAYIIVRTRWAARGLLDAMIWASAAIPGILSGLGLLFLFLDTPGLRLVYGTIWALIIVVIIGGKTTGVNVFKGVFVQLGQDLEEAGRVSGAGWLRTYTRVVIPVLMPTMVLIGLLSFAAAASATSSIVLLASREIRTLSLITLELAAPEVGKLEEAGIVSLIIMALTLGGALIGRYVAGRIGLEKSMSAKGGTTQPVITD